jgi:uncharacterized membrane protein YfcA
MARVTPSATLVLALSSVAFAAGFIDAVAGGGGLLTVPAILAAGVLPHAALATNKGQSVFGSGAALVAFARRGTVDRSLAWLTFPLGFVGSLAGAQLVLLLSPATLRPLVLVLLPLAAGALFLKRPVDGTEPPQRRLLRAGVLAASIGAYDGFFGPGTGTFLVVGFAALLHSSPLAATADAKVVNFASNLAALALFAAHGVVIWQLSLPMGAAQLLGGYAGAHAAVRGGDRLVRLAVVCVVLALMIKLALDLRA